MTLSAITKRSNKNGSPDRYSLNSCRMDYQQADCRNIIKLGRLRDPARRGLLEMRLRDWQ
jgi:hypothetical protein